MRKHNEQNERVKRAYYAYLREAQGYSEQSVDAVAKALGRFEEYTKYRDFKSFHQEQAVAFKRYLIEQPSHRCAGKLSKSTVRSTLSVLKGFFKWLPGRPGFRSRLTYADAEYFNLSDRDSRVALAQRPRAVPTLEQVQHVLEVMPVETAVQRRDRALVAFILLTGCRDRAAVDIKLKHINIDHQFVFQDAREVQTKFGKTMRTDFFPVGDTARDILLDWLMELRCKHLWSADDPIFPATRVGRGADGIFRSVGIERRAWSNADAVRRIFKAAFNAAHLPYFNPHSFRHLLGRLGQQLCRTPEEMKAWSQNCGHEQTLTTLTSYGKVDEQRQADIIRALRMVSAKDVRFEKTLRDLLLSR